MRTFDTMRPIKSVSTIQINSTTSGEAVNGPLTSLARPSIIQACVHLWCAFRVNPQDS